MVMPTEPIRDVMRRTVANLNFIESHAGPDGPYEVTQLINSFLGALAHPYEAMKPSLMALPTSAAVQRGWPAIAKEHANDAEPASLGDLVRLMRNGFAHGNIEFLPGPKGDIKALRLWNTNPPGKRTWGAIITVADARALLVRFAELIEELHEQQEWYAPRSA